jgi:hypothetical protein
MKMILADISEYRDKGSLLYEEMTPSDTQLKFKIINGDEKYFLRQIATFRPKGLLGRLYWYSVLPFHYFVFDGMAKNIIKYEKNI